MLTERLQILVDPEQRRRLDAEAGRRGTSVASLIREAVDSYLGRIPADDRRGALEAIRAMEGRFLAPAELDRIAEEQGEAQADALARPGRK